MCSSRAVATRLRIADIGRLPVESAAGFATEDVSLEQDVGSSVRQDPASFRFDVQHGPDFSSLDV